MKATYNDTAAGGKKLLATSASRILLAPFLLALLSFGVVQADDQLNIVTVAGKDAEIGDGGPATSAQLNLPAAVAFDFSGNRYICEGTGHRVRKVNPAGIITTFAGTGGSGFNGDNIPATTAQLNAPGFVIVDSSGNLYVSEVNGNRIRKVVPGANGVIDGASDEIITTVAGTGVAGFIGCLLYTSPSPR